MDEDASGNNVLQHLQRRMSDSLAATADMCRWLHFAASSSPADVNDRACAGVRWTARCSAGAGRKMAYASCACGARAGQCRLGHFVNSNQYMSDAHIEFLHF